MIELGFDPPCELLVPAFGDGHLLVAVGNELLSDANGHRPTRTGGALRGSAAADVVGVANTLLVAGIVELQPRLASAAVQGAFQVVVVLAAAFAGGGAGVQKSLNLLPRLYTDDRFVGAGVKSPLVADLSDVVRITQQLEERGPPHRPRRTLRRRHRGQSSCGGFGQQVRDGVLTGRVGLEDPPDEGRTVGVDLNGPVLPTLRVALADVAVADRCPAWSAACGDFLGHALGHFGGEVAGVELRNRGHDPVQQHPRRGLVDVLGRGDQLDAGVDELAVDVDVIEPVTGQPIDLVHDAIRDLMGRNVIQ
nr:hypothetical protein [Schaalia hyovaginalis]